MDFYLLNHDREFIPIAFIHPELEEKKSLILSFDSLVGSRYCTLTGQYSVPVLLGNLVRTHYRMKGEVIEGKGVTFFNRELILLVCYVRGKHPISVAPEFHKQLVFIACWEYFTNHQSELARLKKSINNRDMSSRRQLILLSRSNIASRFGSLDPLTPTIQDCSPEVQQVLSGQFLRELQSIKTSFAVGDFVVITKGDRDWVSAMDTFVGKVVQVLTVRENNIITFAGDEGFTWSFSNGHFMPAMSGEIAQYYAMNHQAGHEEVKVVEEEDIEEEEEEEDIDVTSPRFEEEVVVRVGSGGMPITP